MQQVRTKKTMPVLYMEPTVEKDEFGEVVRSGLYLRRNGAYFVERKKLYRRFPTW
jgi:hypothetical protein